MLFFAEKNAGQYETTSFSLPSHNISAAPGPYHGKHGCVPYSGRLVRYDMDAIKQRRMKR